jgi:branched-chain amino acid transport system substrate-binding protein
MTYRVSRRSLLAGAATATVFRTGPSRAAGKTIRIGVLTDMEGTYGALTGAGCVLGTQLAAEDFAKEHPGIAVEVLSADMQLKPDVAVAIAGDWFDNKSVDLLMDLPLSSAAIAIGQMCKEKDKLAIYNGAASSVLTGEKCGPNHLHWSYDTWSAPHALVQASLKDGTDTWFFIAADYAFGHMLASDSAGFVTAGGGKVLGTANYPFPGTTDFSAFLLQAKASGAKAIGLANGGVDTVNCIKQAHEFGLAQSGVKLGAVGMLVPDVLAIGLEVAQGVRLVEPYYWDFNDGTRAFARRFAARMQGHPMPDSAQAGQYSSTRHYLKAVAAIGADKAKASGRATLAEMRKIPIRDDIFGESTIRDDGRVIHATYLLEVKKPSESKETWDLMKVVGTVPANEAFRPINAGGCPLIHA